MSRHDTNLNPDLSKRSIQRESSTNYLFHYHKYWFHTDSHNNKTVGYNSKTSSKIQEMVMSALPNNNDDFPIDDELEETESLGSEYDIAVYPSDLTLRVIEQMWDRGDISIPSFQRRFVWTITQSSLLIESFLLGLPVPQVFLYIDDEHRNLVIDGQQRILSIVYFFNGFFGDENHSGRRKIFKLQGIPKESRFYGKKYVDLEQKDQRKLENSILRAVNVRQLSPNSDNSSVYHIFERLNTGGTPLRPQEIRNCVYSGALVKELNELNQIDSWRKLIGRVDPEKHQRDVELILRVFALWEHWEDYERPMKNFLNEQMMKHQNADSRKFKNFKRDFETTVVDLLSLLGSKPFHVRGPLNVAALDSILSLSVRNINHLPTDLKRRTRNLIKQKEYRDAIFSSTSDTQSVNTRMSLTYYTLFES